MIKFLFILLMPVITLADNINTTPDFNTDTNILNIPVLRYNPNNAASVKLLLDFNNNTFAIEELKTFDCSMLKTYFSPYPTNDNFNPCEYLK